MSRIVADPGVGMSFAVLLIVRLLRSGDITLSATLCQHIEQFTPARTFVESRPPVARKRFRIL